MAPSHPDAYTTLGMIYESRANAMAEMHEDEENEEKEKGDSVGDYFGVGGAVGLGSQGSIAWGGNATPPRNSLRSAQRALQRKDGSRALQIKALEMFFIAAELDRKSVASWRRAAEMSLAIAADILHDMSTLAP